MKEAEIKMECSKCEAYRRCREAFAEHLWKIKSNGGRGCATPLRVTPETLDYYKAKKAAEKEAAWAGAGELARSCGGTTRGRENGILATQKHSLGGRLRQARLKV